MMGGSPMKATDEQLARSYERTRSVRETADEFGMAPQTVHARLGRAGVDTSGNPFTKDDERYLSERYVPYRDAGQLQALADEMGRTKAFICRKAGDLGLTDRSAPKVYHAFWKDAPREVVCSIWADFKRSKRGIHAYCSAHHYGENEFSRCMRRNYPDEYDDVVESKQPRRTKYRIGRDFEYATRDNLARHGYLVLRSPASKSPADLYAIKRGELVFVQCKANGAIGVSEWNGFLAYCESVGATPVISQRHESGRGIRYDRITAPKDGSRRRQPMEPWSPTPRENDQEESQ